MKEIENIESNIIKKIRNCNSIWQLGKLIIDDYLAEYYQQPNESRMNFIAAIVDKYYELKENIDKKENRNKYEK